MKVMLNGKDIEVVEYELVYADMFDDCDKKVVHNIEYHRYGSDCWKHTIGDEVIDVWDCSKLERQYQEKISKIFDLEKSLDGRLVKTTNGSEVSQLTLFKCDIGNKLVGTIRGVIHTWYENGRYGKYDIHHLDLTNA